MAKVDVGNGAFMPMPSAEVEQVLRYGSSNPSQATLLEAAEILAAYRHLVRACSRDEAWRRVKLIREAEAKYHAEKAA